MEDSLITAWLEEWTILWGTEDLVGRVHVEPGRRLRSSLGRCHPDSGRVQIHPALFEPEHAALLREVVCHEAAHAAAHLLHGRRVRPHGREWKALMVAAGYPPKARLDPARMPEGLRARLQRGRPYRHSCPACGTSRMARRAFRQWRCRTCLAAGMDGKLEIVRIAERRVRSSASTHPS